MTIRSGVATTFGLFSFIGVTLLITVATYLYFGDPWNRALFISPLYKLPTTEKKIALTFDDGPSPARTPALLDLLDKHQVKATFFMIGMNIEKYPDITEDVVARGHVAANHSYSHPRLIFKSPSLVEQEIIKTNELLKKAGSDDWYYFRPPNTKKFIILPLVLKSFDMIMVTGSYDPLSQYETPLDGEKVSSQVLANAKPGDIIYLHDGRDDSVDEFIKAVETIIVELKAQGYELVTIKE